MAWSNHFLPNRASPPFPRKYLIEAPAYAVLTLLILGGVWLNLELAWSFRDQPHRPPPAPPADIGDIAGTIAQRHLFGQHTTAPAPGNTPDYRLLGVLLSQRQNESVAILQSTEGKPAQLVKIGQDLAPGLQLIALSEQQAVLARAGEKLTVILHKASPQQIPLSSSKPVFD